MAGRRRFGSVGSATVDSSFRIASLTKPLTAVATVLASSAQGVSLDTLVIDLLPDLRSDWHANRDLTLSNILSQTSGLSATVSAQEITHLGDGNDAILEAARMVVRAGSSRPPGKAWEYYNGNYFLAGAAIEALTASTYESALSQLLLRPWNLTSFTPRDDLVRGVEDGSTVHQEPYPRGRRPSGGLCSSAADLLTFGEQLLGCTAVLQQARRVRTAVRDPMRYGLGWAIGPSGQMYLNGRLPGYRTVLMLVPDHDLVGVALTADSAALTAAARAVSDIQRDLTGDDLADLIDRFAA